MDRAKARYHIVTQLARSTVHRSACAEGSKDYKNWDRWVKHWTRKLNKRNDQ